MKISDFRPDDIRANETQLNRPEKAPVKRQEAGREAAPDRFSISPFSETLLNELDKTSKVEALKSAYESGAYRVDPESLASSLVKAHLALPEAKPATSKQE